jgi:putative ABC transport system permease protein
MVTVVAAPAAGDAPGPSRLVELKAVAPGYPYYGTLTLAPQRPLADLLGPRSVVAAPELLSALGLRVGDTLLVGGERFTIAGEVLGEPDRVQVGLTLGPRLLISPQGLDSTGLIQKGSQVDYRTLVAMPPGTTDARLTSVAERLRDALGNRYRVETWRQAQPSLRRGVQQVDRFLGLVALLSLLVGGVGVAVTVRAWVAGRLDAVAVLKALGVRPREVFALFLGQTAVLALVGSALGAIVGVAVQLALPHLFPDLVPAALLDPWQPAALGRGLALGLGVALLFSIPPLAAVLRVPPARVFRRDAEPPPPRRGTRAAFAVALAAGVLAMAWWQAGSLLHGAQFTGALLVVTAALTLAAGALVRGAGRLPRGGAGLGWRFGVAALARPGAGTVGAVVALGLGVLVVCGMALVQRQLSAELSANLPAEAPTVFLVDIQPDQWPGVEGLLTAAGAERIESVPVVMARFTAIDGHAVDDLVAERGEDRGARWALTREQRLTYLDRLPADNKIVAGSLWSDPDRPEVSVEEEFAHDLGVGVGSTLELDVQGVPLTLTVTSLRSVEWQSFGINFFLVVEPGVLDDAPQQRVAAARMPAGGEQRLQDELAAHFPNVTALRLREILEKIVGVLERIGLAVRFLGGFTVLAGVAILAGAVAAGAARRGREVALLKTLGVTRAGVVRVFSTEYALVGMVAGVLGAAGAAALSWTVLTRWMEIGWSSRPWVLTVAVGGAVVLSVAAGLAASGRALSRRPIEVLRDAG